MSIDSLLPRPDLLSRLHETLKRGSVLLHGPRRVGKSTTLEQLSERAHEELLVIRIDLEGYRERPVEALIDQLLADLSA